MRPTNLWETRIHGACAVVSARGGGDVELWMCANVGQVSLDPPRIAINPPRLCPVWQSIRKERRFAVGMLHEGLREAAIRLSRIRRHAPHKPELIGLRCVDDPRYGIPFAALCRRTFLCEAEEFVETGDHIVVIARFLQLHLAPGWDRERPLLYSDIAASLGNGGRLKRAVEWTFARMGRRRGVQDLQLE